MTNAAQASWKKYIRTLQHREDLAECLKQYAALQPYETYQSGDGEYERWRPTVPPPLEIAILAGEAFYQTRSILDHLFYALVERREGPECPDDDADWKKVQFPIRIERPKGSSHTRVPREDFKNPNWMWISEDAYRFIESVQPYHPRQPIATALKRLAEFSRIINIGI